MILLAIDLAGDAFGSAAASSTNDVGDPLDEPANGQQSATQHSKQQMQQLQSRQVNAADQEYEHQGQQGVPTPSHKRVVKKVDNAKATGVVNADKELKAAKVKSGKAPPTFKSAGGS